MQRINPQTPFQPERGPRFMNPRVVVQILILGFALLIVTYLAFETFSWDDTAALNIHSGRFTNNLSGAISAGELPALPALPETIAGGDQAEAQVNTYTQPTPTPQIPTPTPIQPPAVQPKAHTPETMPYSNLRRGDYLVLVDQQNQVTDYAPILSFLSCQNLMANGIEFYKSAAEQDLVAWMLLNHAERQAFVDGCDLQPEVQLPDYTSILECHRVHGTAYTYHVSYKVDPQGHQQFEVWQRLSKEQRLAFDAQCKGM